MDLGKVVFDAGHYAGANRFESYSEGNSMLDLALKLKDKGFDITREDGKDMELLARVRRAVSLGADTLISLHTDWIPPDNKNTKIDESKLTEGVMPIYSLNRPEDKAIAEELGKGLANAMGITFNKLYTRPASRSTSANPIDYYGILRCGVNLGLKHIFIIEHCSHLQMSIDTEKKLNAITDYYTKMFKGTVNKSEEVEIMVDKSFIKKVIVTTDNLNVRQKPNTSNSPLGTFKLNEVVYVTGMISDWYRVIFEGKDAYISSKYARDVIEDTTDYKSKYNDVSALNIQITNDNKNLTDKIIQIKNIVK